jgi:hypothetical protein
MATAAAPLRSRDPLTKFHSLALWDGRDGQSLALLHRYPRKLE